MSAVLSRIKIAVAFLVGVGAIAGSFWYSSPGSSPRTVHEPASRAMIDAILARETAQAPAQAPAAQPADTQPQADASPDDRPEPSAPPLEDVIEQSMPGVVMIQTPKGRGSGFYVRPDLVMTNAHVIAGSTAVSVTTQSGAELAGRVAFVSDEVDVALVQVGRLGLAEPQLKLGESGSLRLGEGIVALGWAESLEQRTVARGVVTGLRRVLGRPFLQTDAAPHRGDSGGPVIDRKGEVVGITTARADDGTAGFVVPIDDAKPLIARVTDTAMPPSLTDAAAAAVERPSTIDTQRATGADNFTSTLAALARRADALDTWWNQYRSSCRVTAVPGGHTREWFHLYDPHSPLHQTAAYCATALNALQAEADAIHAAMLGADEAARRADVFPGTRRELRRRFRLDYAGWER